MDVPLSPPRDAAGEAVLRAGLRRHKAVATGLLAGMGAATIGSYWLPPGYAADLVQASAKAGLVGGLADWFAVTALFRHPMGLPIPHTAIIPKQKERLGAALGRFVANHVFTEGEIRAVLARLDAAALLGGLLSDPAAARPTTDAMARLVPRLLRGLEGGGARRFVRRLLPRIVTGPALGRLVARTLRNLMAGGQHHAVFDLAVGQIRSLLAAKEESLRTAVAERVRAEGGALVGWLAGGAVARRVLSAVNEAVAGLELEDSDLRAAFEAYLLSEIEALETDPSRAESYGAALRRALAHPSVSAWLTDAWARIREAVEADAADPRGRTAALLGGLLDNLAAMLASDETTRAAVNRSVERAILTYLPAAQGRVAGFIGGVVGNWDTATITDKIELRVGRDLQYVRINGTVVGALAGGALFVLLHAIFGRVAT